MIRWFFLLIGILLFLSPVYAEETISESVLPVDSYQPADMAAALDILTKEISDELAQIRMENEKSAESLARTGISGEEATAVLSAKLDNITYGHSSLIISPENVITAAAPSQYSGLIGSDLKHQSETRFANEQQSPVISDIFYLEEGFYGISISYPVFSQDETYLGYTDVTIRPEEFLRSIIVPFTEQTGDEVFIFEPDGMTVYETNEVEIGKNVLTDPLYDTPEMQNVSSAVIDNQEGIIEYTFWDRYWSKQVPRRAVWKTLLQDNQEWRIGIVRNLDEDDPSPPTDSISKSVNLNASIADMTSFVRGAATYARTVGQEEACGQFNNISGPYVTNNLYIFGYDINGTTLALPYQPGLLGKNRIGFTDVNGFSIIASLIDSAKRGEGNLYGVYPNPENKFQNQLKLYRVEMVDSEWLVGSGIYLPLIAADLEQKEIDALITRARDAVSHVEMVGKEQAIADFNDLNQSFANGGAYIFAYDYDGTTLALPYQPEYIGTNRMNFTDPYGVSIIAQEVSAAKSGEGFVYVVYYNPDTSKNELKLCYVLPAGDDWMVGSGIYTGTDLV